MRRYPPLQKTFRKAGLIWAQIQVPRGSALQLDAGCLWVTLEPIRLCPRSVRELTADMTIPSFTYLVQKSILSAYYLQMIRKAKERPQAPYRPLCYPFYPVTHPAPSLRSSASQIWRQAELWGSRGPRKSCLQPLPLPSSLVALRQLYGGQIEAVSLLAGLFLHLSNPALSFSPWPPYPHLLPGKVPLPPPHLSAWLGKGPLASQVNELWGRQARLCRSTFGFLPCRSLGGWKGGDCGQQIANMAPHL